MATLLHAADLGRLPPRWERPAHLHADSHELVLVAEGRVDMDIAGRRLETHAGWAKFHPAGVEHAERAVGPRGPVLLLLAWRDEPAATTGWPLQRDDPHGRIATLLRWLVELCRRPREPAVDSVFRALLAAYADGRTGAGDALIEAVRAQVQARLAEPLYLADLARAAHLSPFHFARRFRAAAGCSPMAFVRRQRVERVRSLLLTTAMPLRAIAPLAGFRDEFQLSRVYKQVTGQPPRGARG